MTKTENVCIRCPETGFSDDDQLTITLSDNKLGDQTMTLCDRCAIFILGAMGATPSMVVVPHPQKDKDVIIDIMALSTSQVALVAKKLRTAHPCIMSGGHQEGADHEEDVCPVKVIA